MSILFGGLIPYIKLMKNKVVTRTAEGILFNQRNLHTYYILLGLFIFMTEGSILLGLQWVNGTAVKVIRDAVQCRVCRALTAMTSFYETDMTNKDSVE